MDNKTVDMFEKIWEKLAEIPTRGEVEKMLTEKRALDWKGITKLAAILVPASGGIGAVISQIIQSFQM